MQWHLLTLKFFSCRFGTAPSHLQIFSPADLAWHLPGLPNAPKNKNDQAKIQIQTEIIETTMKSASAQTKISYSIQNIQTLLKTTKLCENHQIFFSCIAVLVRDIVGQQLEWVKKEIKFPRKQKPTRTNTPTKQSNTHKKPNQAKIQGNLQTRWNRWNVRVPLKPLTSSLPPSSIAPRCPCLDVFHINVCTRITRRVSNIW